MPRNPESSNPAVANCITRRRLQQLICSKYYQLTECMQSQAGMQPVLLMIGDKHYQLTECMQSQAGMQPVLLTIGDKYYQLTECMQSQAGMQPVLLMIGGNRVSYI